MPNWSPHSARRLFGAVVFLAALSGCGEDPLSVAETLDLVAAEQRWAERGFDDYAFTTRRTCFCDPDLLLRVEVEVRGGRVAGVRDLAADTLLSAELNGAWYTIDDLFQIIRQGAGGGQVSNIAVAFDPALGYPTTIATRYDPSILDAGGSYEVTSVRPLSSAPVGLQALIPGVSFPAWYQQQTGYVPDSVYFGAYSMEPIAGTLYAGFGTNRPTAVDGALLGAVDQAGLRVIASLPEQGFLDMAAAEDGTLLIPGVDPCCPDGWEAGNFHTYSPQAGLIKHRTLPNVIHSWRLWYDQPETAVYVTTGSHRGDGTYTGEIWRSADRGATWTRLAVDRDSVGTYRTADVVRYQGRLHAISEALGRICKLVVQESAGMPWPEVLPGRHLACRHELIPFGDELLALDQSRSVVHVVSASGGSEVALPFTVDAPAYNWATVVDRYLFAIANDGRVLRTYDLRTWDTVAQSSLDLIIIRYWPHRGSLVVASRGAAGSLWSLRLCGVEPC